ncbi:MAG: hypothetical protein V7K73_14055 [Nostoc sp.]
MEQFLIQKKTVSETSKMILQTITDISAKSQNNQITFHQLEILGMEKFLAKLKTQSEPNNSIDYSRMSEDFAA